MLRYSLPAGMEQAHLPADHPKILGLVLIDEPQGVYYGGVIAAPVMAEIFQNVLPYLDNL